MYKYLACVVLILMSCAARTMNVNGFTLKADDWERDRWIIRQQAAFDLGCPKDELTLTVLNHDYYNATATNVGASGCDKRVRYIRVTTKSSAEEWVRQN
jgi:hypothetical protein